MEIFEVYTVKDQTDLDRANTAGLLDGINLNGCKHCGEEVGQCVEDPNKFTDFAVVLIETTEGYAACRVCYAPLVSFYFQA
jgi:hypothetical protein